MNFETRKALATLNRRFYRDHAESFHRTRFAPWRGWDRLLERIAAVWPRERPLRVLDVGCGNGRFGALVQERWKGAWTYLGLDGSEELLEAARRRLREAVPSESGAGVLRAWELRSWDLLDGLPEAMPGEDFDLIGLFGVLHHVPGAEERRELLVDCASRLAGGGFLAYTVWRFGEDARFESRIVPWPTTLEVAAGETDGAGTQAGRIGAADGAEPLRPGAGGRGQKSGEPPRCDEIPLDPSQLDEGDFLLRWGDSPDAIRYCHAAGDEEQERWLEELSLDLVLRFDGDGKSGRLNRYFLLQRGLVEGSRSLLHPSRGQGGAV